MADFQLAPGYTFIESVGVDLSNSRGTVATTASADTPTGWVELSSSTAEDSYLLKLYLSPENTSNITIITRIDIAVGGAGSEEIIGEGLFYKVKRSAGICIYFDLPIYISAGSRVSFRITTGGSGDMVFALGQLYAGSFPTPTPFSQVVPYGVVSTTDGVQIDPGGTANTKGAWFEIDASVSNIEQFIFAVYVETGTQQVATFLIDIAVGGAGSEEIIVENMQLNECGTEALNTPPRFDIKIPAGSRVAVRAQCSINDAADRILEVSILGIS